ncbi:biosynthetic peptidoglycan transglycosylase [Spirochaeta africana]|uniref:Transglycosylase n=1 Tax=Spirochaeta africana (strain ATCC 700263 / DSM 8902 / Z-7692) TaxID=889378 RepID=H9UL97_SPIAZ|nr:biosynthetic peptidoglycan transglycosylase [Spirochaeta africana]AFG38290.1 Transglycosylase [Spirochaeta africana DSM 8902]
MTRTHTIIIAGAATAILVGFWLLTPLLIRSVVTSRLDRIAAGSRTEINYDNLQVSFRRVLSLEQLSVRRGDAALEANRLQFRIRPLALLRRGIPIDELLLQDVQLRLADTYTAELDQVRLLSDTIQIDSLLLQEQGSPPLLQLPLLRATLKRPLTASRTPRLESLAIDSPRIALPSAGQRQRLATAMQALNGTSASGSPEGDAAPGSATEAAAPPDPGHPQDPAPGQSARTTSLIPARIRELLPEFLQVRNAAVSAPHSTIHAASLFYRIDRTRQLLELRSTGSLQHNGAPAGSWEIHHDLYYEQGQIEGFTNLNSIDLAAAFGMLGEPWRQRVRSGILDLELAANNSLTGRWSLSRGSVLLPQISPEPIEPIDLSYRFTAEQTRDSLRTTSGQLRAGDIISEFRPGLRGLQGFRQLPEYLTAEVVLPPTELQEILHTIPHALTGELRDIVIDGTVAVDFRVEVPIDSVAAMQWQNEIVYQDIYLHDIPDSLNVFRLRGPFLHHIYDPAVDFERVIRIGPMQQPSRSWLMENGNLSEEAVDELLQRKPAPTAPSLSNARSILSHRFSPDPIYQDSSYRFVPLAEISPWVPRAVVTAEDGEFFRHQGINWRSVRSALERNLNEGGFAVGASTIPMQLAKNVFLDHSRILARKFQEVVLVILMEQVAAIPKDRQLEIYLNIAEFGPGIFGIYDAARYYFGKHPQDLDPGEAAWLASILPSPKRHHGYYLAGGITDGWFIRMKHILEIMRLRDRIDEESFAQATAAPPAFYYPEESQEEDAGEQEITSGDT